MAAVAPEEGPDPKWGVTVEDVLALAPHVGLGAAVPAEAPVDKVYGSTRPTQKITREQVDQWILDVSARADMRLSRRSKLKTEHYKTRLDQAVHDLVTNGAASYLVAAAFPAKAGPNENTSYSAELWSRFESGLASLALVLDGWLEDELAEAVIAGPVGRISAFFPPSRIPDTLRW